MIRVFVVDEVPLVADVLAAVLREEEDIEVVGHTDSPDEALERADSCDVVLLSATLPDGAAVTFAEQISRLEDAPHVLVTGVADFEATIVRYIEAGASGYVLRDDTVQDLLANIRAARANEALVSPEIAMAVMSRMAELVEQRQRIVYDDAAAGDLTPREREVLRLIARGKTNQEIADELVIEVGTVKNHVHSILSKLNVNSRHDAAAIQAILSDLED